MEEGEGEGWKGTEVKEEGEGEGGGVLEESLLSAVMTHTAGRGCLV